MTTEHLMELAAKVEQAEGPDRELDEAIRLLVERNEKVVLDLTGGYVPPSTPAYTASLDAAMMLVPEGAAWIVGFAVDGVPFANVDFDRRTTAATPALALVAASLRAKAQSLGGENDG